MEELEAIRNEMLIDSSHTDKEISNLRESLDFAHAFIVELQQNKKDSLSHKILM